MIGLGGRERAVHRSAKEVGGVDLGEACVSQTAFTVAWATLGRGGATSLAATSLASWAGQSAVREELLLAWR